MIKIKLKILKHAVIIVMFLCSTYSIVYSQSSKDYYHSIVKNSKRYGLHDKMMLAIAEVESHFNSKAVSVKNARGIMQIVPSTAGIEAWKYVYGKDSIPPHDSVFDDPHINIRMGCAYIALLNKKYFKDISDPRSKHLCLIAAYNTGVSNVIKVFVTKDDSTEIEKYVTKSEYNKMSKFYRQKIKMKIMINKINSSDPDTVKKLMIEKLPYNETVAYLNNVVEKMDR